MTLQCNKYHELANEYTYLMINYLLKRKFKAEEPDREMKNYIFSIYFLNQDAPCHFKFSMLKDKGHIEGTVSQVLI